MNRPDGIFRISIDELVKSQKVKKWPHQAVVIGYYLHYNSSVAPLKWPKSFLGIC
jgi:hypothetical protein